MTGLFSILDKKVSNNSFNLNSNNIEKSSDDTEFISVLNQYSESIENIQSRDGATVITNDNIIIIPEEGLDVNEEIKNIIDSIEKILTSTPKDTIQKAIQDINKTLEKIDFSNSDTIEDAMGILASMMTNVVKLDDTMVKLPIDAEQISTFDKDNTVKESLSSIYTFIQDSEDKYLQNETTAFDDFTKLLSKLFQESSESVSNNKKEDMTLNLDKLQIDNRIENIFNVNTIESSSSQEVHPVAKEILRAIESKFTIADLDNKTVQLRLKLFPSNLGNISIELEQSLNSLTVKMVCENSEVKRILEQSLDFLQSELNQKSNQGVSIDISSGENNNREFQQQADGVSREVSNNDEYIVKTKSKIEISNRILDIKI